MTLKDIKFKIYSKLTIQTIHTFNNSKIQIFVNNQEKTNDLTQKIRKP